MQFPILSSLSTEETSLCPIDSRLARLNEILIEKEGDDLVRRTEHTYLYLSKDTYKWYRKENPSPNKMIKLRSQFQILFEFLNNVVQNNEKIRQVFSRVLDSWWGQSMLLTYPEFRDTCKTLTFKVLVQDSMNDALLIKNLIQDCAETFNTLYVHLLQKQRTIKVKKLDIEKLKHACEVFDISWEKNDKVVRKKLKTRLRDESLVFSSDYGRWEGRGVLESIKKVMENYVVACSTLTVNPNDFNYMDAFSLALAPNVAVFGNKKAHFLDFIKNLYDRAAFMNTGSTPFPAFTQTLNYDSIKELLQNLDLSAISS